LKSKLAFSFFIVLLIFSTSFSSSMAVNTPINITVKRSSTWNAKLDVFNRMYESYIEEVIEAENNFSRPFTGTLYSISEKIQVESLVFSDKTPKPEIIRLGGDLYLLKWWNVTVPPESSLKFKYTAKTTAKFPLKIERYICVNGKLQRLIRGISKYRVKADIGDIISICMKFTNEADELFINGDVMKPPIYLQIRINYDDSMYDLLSPQISSQYGSPSYTLTVTNSKWFNVTMKVLSLGSWGEIEIPDVTIYASISSQAQIAMLMRNLSQLKDLINYLNYMQIIISTLKVYVEAQPLTSISKGEISNTYNSIDLIEKSIIESLNQYERTLNEYEEAINNITKSHPSLKDPLSNINETLNNMEASIENAKEQITGYFANLKLTLQNQQTQITSETFQPVGLTLDILLTNLETYQKNLEAQLEYLVNLADLTNYIYMRENYPRAWFTLNYMGKDYMAIHIKHLYKDEWSLENIDLLPGVTSKNEKIYLLYIILISENANITSVEYKANGMWMPIRDLNSLDIRGGERKLIIPIFNTLDVESRNIINILKHPLIGDIRIIFTSENRPKINIEIVKAVKPSYVAFTSTTKTYEIGFNSLLISSLPEYKGIFSQPSVKPKANLTYIIIIGSILTCGLIIIFIWKHGKRGEKRDLELEEIERRLKKLMDKLAN